MIFLTLLPFSAYLLLVLFFFSVERFKKSMLESIVFAYIIVFFYIVIVTESLSFFKNITSETIILAWVILVVTCCGYLFAKVKKNDFYFSKKSIVFEDFFIHFSIVSILSLTLLTALVYPPVTWDSMTYHMGRIPHWISNQSVDFYHTSISRQNYQMPLAEYAILHLQLLTDSDLLANLVQWTSFGILVCLSSLISGSLGLEKKQQMLSAIAMVTLPMAIAEASSTQNDLVASVFIMASCYFFIKLSRSISAENIFFLSISLGLACLTKGSSYLICITMALFLAIRFIVCQKQAGYPFSKIIGTLIIILTGTILLNTLFLSRMYTMYGKFTPNDSNLYKNEEISLPVISSNVIRNMALHIGLPNTAYNNFCDSLITGILKEELNNPKSTWPGTHFQTCYSRHEDTAGNFIHFLLILAFYLATPFFKYSKKYPQLTFYSLGILSSFLFFCVILKWQPWASRLHTPIFALATPLIAVFISEMSKNIYKYFYIIIIVILSISGMNSALRAQPRSLVSLEWLRNEREHLYFLVNDTIRNDYLNAITAICLDNTTRIKNVEIDMGSNDWEYPLWAIAKKRCASDTFQLTHINVTKRFASKYYPYLLATHNFSKWDNSENYTPLYVSNAVHVYKKKPCSPSAK